MILIFTRDDLALENRSKPIAEITPSDIDKAFEAMIYIAERVYFCDGSSAICIKDRGLICRSICATECQFDLNRFPFRALSSLTRT